MSRNGNDTGKRNCTFTLEKEFRNQKKRKKCLLEFLMVQSRIMSFPKGGYEGRPVSTILNACSEANLTLYRGP